MSRKVVYGSLILIFEPQILLCLTHKQQGALRIIKCGFINHRGDCRESPICKQMYQGRVTSELENGTKKRWFRKQLSIAPYVWQLLSIRPLMGDPFTYDRDRAVFSRTIQSGR